MGRRGPGKDSQRKPLPRGSLLRGRRLPSIPAAARRGSRYPWESWTTLPSLLCRARREDHRDAAPSTVLEKPGWHDCCSFHLSSAGLWPARNVTTWRGVGQAGGAWSVGLAWVAHGRGAVMSGPPWSGASLPNTGQPRVGPGARSLPRRAARALATAALASRARFGPALELLPGQPAPARARPVSAGPAPRSWLGSASGSRPR